MDPSLERAVLDVTHPNDPILSSRNGSIRDLALTLFLRKKDRDAGSGSGMTGRDCHSAMLILMSSRNGGE